MNMAKAAIGAIQARPLSGWGFGGYGLVAVNRDTHAFPHNIILELWVECGVFSLIPLAILFFYPLYVICYNINKRHPDAHFLLLLLVLIFYWIMASMFADLVDEIRPLYMFLTVAALSVLWSDTQPVNPVQQRLDVLLKRLKLRSKQL
jgi:O-antigen ligase